MDKILNAGFVLVVLLFIEGAQLCFCTNTTSTCIERERWALLKLKRSFQDPANRLADWSGQDCCRWEGVRCNEKTGHVVNLDLRGSWVDEDGDYFTSEDGDYWFSEEGYHGFNESMRLRSPELNSCLLELKHLEYLDQSGNNFSGSQIPNFLGYMKHLKYLNLSCAQFGGIIPHQLGNLSSLQVLDLSSAGLSGIIPHQLGNLSSLQILDLGYQEWISGDGILLFDNLNWVSSLSSLQNLDLSWVDLSNATNWMQVLSKIPSLLQIRLIDCSINSIYLPRGYNNSTFLSKVQVLDLTENKLSGPIPNILQNMTSLRELSFGGNNLNSTIPLWLNHHKSLVYLDLSSNQFDNIEGGLLSMLNDACSLKSLDLYFNALRGEVLGSNQTLSGCIVYDLESLSLWDNEIGGNIPSWFGQLKSLKYLHLESNSFYGPIPMSLGKLSSLKLLYLSNNHLNGPIPMSFGQLSSLEYLDLSNNSLNDLSNNHLNGAIHESLGQLGSLQYLDLSSNSLVGIFSELHFANLSRLKEFNIGSNNLSWKVKSDWIPPFRLRVVNMSSCNIGSQFPRWLQTQTEVSLLDLSNSSISGSFPTWLQGLSLGYLDLSMNSISGQLPLSIFHGMPTLRVLRLSNNLLNGSIPNSLCKVEGLQALDLSKNQLYGEIPDCWRDTHWLGLINLAFNRLSGHIPSSFGQIDFLISLHLNENALSGELPSTLQNSIYLEVLDVGENKITGNIPTWIGERLSPLRILRLRNNTFSGSIPSQLCKLSALQIMDLAQNNLTGRIPRCFSKLTSMTAEKDEFQQYSEPTPSSTAMEPTPSSTAMEPTPSSTAMEPTPSSIAMEPTPSSTAMEPTPSSIAVAPAPPPTSPTYYAGAPTDGVWRKEKVSELMKGLYLEYTKNLRLLDNMDLSSNKLEGCIPKEIIALNGLRGLNLSHNRLSGEIPNKIGKMKSLESLDLSNNHLVGTIPNSLAELTYLSHLNLSNNNLSGRIPTGNQLQVIQDPSSSYAGNSQLCGTPLEKKCPGDDAPVQPPTSNIHGEDEDKSERFWSYFVIVLGYGTGFWAVIGTLILKKNWRVAYFRFADNTKEWMLMMIAVKAERLKKKMRRTNSSE
ncbi:hypothetical protein UlMin_024582 [Ulmus minor]